MDKSQKETKKLERVVSVLIIIIFISVVAAGWDSMFGSDTPVREVVQATAEPVEVVVTSQIVKAVGGKHRYFFDIRNQDDQPFSGSVKIELLGTNGNVIYTDTFTTNQPIQRGVGTSQFVEASTGPRSVHGDSGVVSYRYTVSVNGSVAKTGEGAISTTLESY
jgi:hypothetical protein